MLTYTTRALKVSNRLARSLRVYQQCLHQDVRGTPHLLSPARQPKAEKGPNELEGYIPFKFSIDLPTREITLRDQGDSIKKVILPTAFDQVKPGTVVLPYTKNQYALKDLHIVDIKPRNLKPDRPHTFTPYSTFGDLAKGFSKMWHKLLLGYNAEIHITYDSKSCNRRDQFQEVINNCLHLHPDIMIRSMPRGTTILVPPQTNFAEVCWLLAPPSDKKKFPERQGLILSHAERKLLQRTHGALKEWATDEYGRAAPLYGNKKKRVWKRSPAPKKKCVLDSKGNPLLLKFNDRTGDYELKKKKAEAKLTPESP